MARAPQALWRREDFPDLSGQDTLDRFFRQLNTFAKQIQAALSGDLALGENIRGGWRDVTFMGGSLPRFKSPIASPRAVTVAQAFDVTSRDPSPVSLSAPAWQRSGEDIVISSLGTLDAAKKYRVIFRIEG